MECFTTTGNENEVADNPAYSDCFIYTACGNCIATSKLRLAIRSTFFHDLFVLKHNFGNVNIFMFEFSYEVVKQAIDIIQGKQVDVGAKQKGRLKFLLTKLKVKFETKHSQNMPSNEDSEFDDGVALEKTVDKEVLNPSSQPGASHLEADNLELEDIHKIKEMDITEARENEENDGEGEALKGLADWTATTSEQNLDLIEHKLISGNKGDKYSCSNCKVTSKYFELAKKHFHHYHKDFKDFRKLLVDTEFERKIKETRIKEISSFIDNSSSAERKKLCLEIKEICGQIDKLIEAFDKIKKSDLDGAPTLTRKKKSVMKMLLDLGEKGDNLIYSFEKET